MAKIVYLGHYDIDGTREGSPACVTVMRYMLSVLTKKAGTLTVISPAFPKSGKSAPRECRREEGYDLVFPASRGKSRNPLMRALRQWHHRRALRRELERQVQEGDTLVVYHSLLLMREVERLRRRRQFRLVLQVCEIYSDVIGDEAGRARETAFIQTADAYVFMTELMERQLNTAHKPFAVCLGTYETAAQSRDTFGDGKIHCVYAGTFDPQKGGGAAAAAAAAFLPREYHMHILGFGTAAQVADMKERVAATAAAGGCTVTYDGCLQGEEYTRFIQKCDIGLSTQNPAAAFNATSFPSKILAYMANGLRVVSIRIPAIEQSAVAEHLCFYDEQTPKDIAEAIRRVGVADTHDGCAVLRELDDAFTKALHALL